MQMKNTKILSKREGKNHEVTNATAFLIYEPFESERQKFEIVLYKISISIRMYLSNSRRENKFHINVAVVEPPLIAIQFINQLMKILLVIHFWHSSIERERDKNIYCDRSMAMT